MTTEASVDTKKLYRQLRNYLPVLNEDQITRLRNMAIGVKNNSNFTEEEILELERKLNRTNFLKKDFREWKAN